MLLLVLLPNFFLNKNQEAKTMANKENKTKEQELFDLETLILEGAETRIPITFDFPTQNGIVQTSAIIRPVSNRDWNNALSKAKNNLANFTVLILQKGLLSSSGEQLSEGLLGKIPQGVADELVRQIQDLSGIKQNQEEQYKLTKELMGF